MADLAAATVSTCPGWSAADLRWHLTEVQAFWATIVAERLESYEAAAAAEPPRPADFGEPDKTAGFVLRRQAHEALIHRRDAESVLGSYAPLDTPLAADGVDEALRIMFASSDDPAEFTADGSVCRVELTDAPDQWTLRLGADVDSGDDSYSVDATTDDHAPAAAVVRAGAADLDLWLWGRGEGGLTVDGDRVVFDRVAAIVAAGVE